MRVAVYGRHFDPDFNKSIYDLFENFKRSDVEVFVFQPFYQFFKEKINFRPDISGFFSNHMDIAKNLDLFLSIGGDGTFLEAITIVRDKGIPMVGINSGRLGFLAIISREELSDSIRDIFANKYSVEERTVIKLETSGMAFKDFNYALNEVTIQKKGSSMITIQTFVDNEFLNSYWADGLIISTPTGSTAYSLSVGGPIVIPSSNNFIISPIAPHNLTVRPIVIPDFNELILKVSGRSSKFIVTLDYRSEIIDSSIEIRIKRADFKIRILKLDHHNFFSTIRSKLMWGADKRN
ncbi:MAG: NAD kinase [Bacteroidales bacterium]|nr:NAD kinase [Bacteroidales bacterium]